MENIKKKWKIFVKYLNDESVGLIKSTFLKQEWTISVYSRVVIEHNFCADVIK